MTRTGYDRYGNAVDQSEIDLHLIRVADAVDELMRLIDEIEYPDIEDKDDDLDPLYRALWLWDQENKARGGWESPRRFGGNRYAKQLG